MRTTDTISSLLLFQLLISFLFSLGVSGSLLAQDSPRTPHAAESLWPLIEKQMEQPGADTTRHFILQTVRSFCGTDDDCLYQAYYAIMIKLERRFDLLAAIFVGEEMVEVAQRQGNLVAEAKTYKNLSRFHGAIGNDRLTIVNLEKALRLFEKLGNQSAVINTKMTLLERSLSYRKIEEVLPEMEALLALATKNKDTASVTYLHLRLLLQTQTAGLYDKMETHIEALEKIPLSDPIKPMEYGRAIHALLGRADLFMVKKNYVEAERFYQKTLRLCEAEPSRWIEIQVLHALSDLEWERGNSTMAKSYLDKAQGKAEKLELDDLLAANYKRKAKIAEAERRFGGALAYIKKQQFHTDKLKAKSAGFNTQSYFLQQEKDQLATEKKNQALELRLKKLQLRNALFITLLVLLLAIGLLVGMNKQRKAKQELAAQNALIQQQTEQLKSLDVAKSRFFANVSHELRTPLTLVLSPIKSLLKENQLTEKQSRLIQTAHQSGKELQQLVNEILDLQKLEVGKMELNEKPTTLAPFFGSYAAQFQSLADRKHIDFSIETNLDNQLSASIDQEKCRQVLYNLLSNAFKFTPSGGQVKVKLETRDEGRGMRNEHVPTASSLTPHPSFLVISVSDTGPGIHPDDLPHLFDRFFQTTRPDKPAEGGTGIGLALCHEYAKMFGGTITAESPDPRLEGKGTVFRVSFPVKLVDSPPTAIGSQKLDSLPVAAAPSLVDEPKSQTATDTLKPTILVVEDNPALQDYIRLILEEKYQVVTAENGQVALQWLMGGLGPDCQQPTANCQLILSDLMMPIMDGYQLLEKLKSDDATRHIPVIMLTARAETQDRLKALRIGVDDYLTKPFDEEELLVRIDNLLVNSRNRQSAILELKPDVDLPANDEAAASVPFVSEPDRVWLESFEAFVQKNLANDTLNIPSLAYKFAMSESTLLRQLKRLTGLSTVQYLQEIRLDKARQLLENRNYDSIAKVADKVGYGDTRSFSRSFKQRFGKSPSDYLSA